MAKRWGIGDWETCRPKVANDYWLYSTSGLSGTKLECAVDRKGGGTARNEKYPMRSDCIAAHRYTYIVGNFHDD